MTTASTPGEAGAQDEGAAPIGNGMSMPEDAAGISNSAPGRLAVKANAFDGTASWLCPIQSDCARRGILNMTAAEYIDLVDKSGRMTR